MSINQRGWAWLNEDSGDPVEHSEAQEREVARLAQEWSVLHSAREQRGFMRQAAFEDGDYGPEPEPCETCGGAQFLGVESEKHSRHGELRFPNWCGDHACPNALFGIKCPACDGGGFDRSEEREQGIRLEQERLQIESVEAALERHGARMMRPYEHWNEMEHEVQWLEEGRFGEYSC